MAREQAEVAVAETKDEGGTQESSSLPQRSSYTSRTGHAASLKTDRGMTSIAESVVGKVAGFATREVPGVYQMGSGTTRAVGAVTQRVGLADERNQGVSVEVGEQEAAVDLTIVVDYGESIPKIAQEIRDNVINRIEGITGLSVTEVNVQVTDVHFPGDDAEQSARVS
jgi:uncharacterized alkaline shock family protein YloU